MPVLTRKSVWRYLNQLNSVQMTVVIKAKNWHPDFSSPACRQASSRGEIPTSENTSTNYHVFITVKTCPGLAWEHSLETSMQHIHGKCLRQVHCKPMSKLLVLSKCITPRRNAESQTSLWCAKSMATSLPMTILPIYVVYLRGRMGKIACLRLSFTTSQRARVQFPGQAQSTKPSILLGSVNW